MGQVKQLKRFRRLARIQAKKREMPQHGFAMKPNGEGKLTSAVRSLSTEKGMYKHLKKRSKQQKVNS